MSHYIGTAGYVYPHWRKGAFYPPGLSQSEELSHYLSNFPSVEINATWHAFPRLSVLQKWRSAAHRQTRFALKAPNVITHEKRLHNAEQDIHAFIKLATEGLADHLGPILFQCPPSLQLSIPLLENFLNTIRAASQEYGPIRVALEFRSPDWFCQPVYDLLAKNDIALVNNITVKDTDFGVLDNLFPHARNIDHPTASWHYNRFHGSKNPQVLTDFPQHILRQFSYQRGVQYSFFLNDWAAIAPKNAMAYAKLCAEARGAQLKALFDGFVPQWTKPRPSIKSFFTPISKNIASHRASSSNIGQSSRNDTKTKSTPSVPSAPPIVKPPGEPPNSVVQENARDGNSSLPLIMKSPVKFRKSVIEENARNNASSSPSIAKSPVKLRKAIIQENIRNSAPSSPQIVKSPAKLHESTAQENTKSSTPQRRVKSPIKLGIQKRRNKRLTMDIASFFPSNSGKKDKG